ncbi:MAG: HNH endonuclease [Planctomycetota bacterium]|jgi:5-methylcytosine-specific restriction endonuclease McrA
MAICSLDSSVLVLNRHYTAVHVVNARRAFCLLFKQIAEVISVQNEQYLSFDFESWKELSALRDNFPGEETEVVRTVSFEILVPRIIRLLFYDKLPRHDVRFNRRNIFARDGNRCQYCGRRFSTTELSLDHVIPRSLGGQSTWENLVCACTECNARKGGRLPAAAGMRLRRQPVKPKRNPVFRISLGSKKYRSWKQFLSAAYWEVELK